MHGCVLLCKTLASVYIVRWPAERKKHCWKKDQSQGEATLWCVYWSTGVSYSVLVAVFLLQKSQASLQTAISAAKIKSIVPDATTDISSTSTESRSSSSQKLSAFAFTKSRKS